MDYDRQFREKEVTEYNEMGFKIQRLHNMWLGITHAREQGSFDSCRWKLDSVEAELAFEMERLDGDEGFKYNDQVKKINEKIDDVFIKRQRRGIYESLLKKEKLLRKIQQEAGMGTRYKGMDDDNMD